MFAREEPTAEIGIAGIVAARPVHPTLAEMRGWLKTLEQSLSHDHPTGLYRVLRDAVPDFQGGDEPVPSLARHLQQSASR
jgi:hypothetical protein